VSRPTPQLVGYKPPPARARWIRRGKGLLRSFPWLPDTAYGVMTAGLGRTMIRHSVDMHHYGWGFLEPIAWFVGPVTILAGLGQALAAFIRRHGWRQACAFTTFFLYASISANTTSPFGSWIYGCIAAIQIGILIRVY
jgi:hypothetical protein